MCLTPAQLCRVVVMDKSAVLRISSFWNTAETCIQILFPFKSVTRKINIFSAAKSLWYSDMFFSQNPGKKKKNKHAFDMPGAYQTGYRENLFSSTLRISLSNYILHLFLSFSEFGFRQACGTSEEITSPSRNQPCQLLISFLHVQFEWFVDLFTF